MSSGLDNPNLTIGHSRCCGGTGSLCFQIQFLARSCRVNHLRADSWAPESCKLQVTTFCCSHWLWPLQKQLSSQKTKKREVEGVNLDYLLWAGIGQASSWVSWRQHGAGPDAASTACRCVNSEELLSPLWTSVSTSNAVWEKRESMFMPLSKCSEKVMYFLLSLLLLLFYPSISIITHFAGINMQVQRDKRFIQGI